MKMSTKAKQALVALRREFGISVSDIKTLLGNTVSIDMIKNFESDAANAEEYLTSFYLDLFSFIVFQRFRFEAEAENFDYEPYSYLPEEQPRRNPFNRTEEQPRFNPFNRKK